MTGRLRTLHVHSGNLYGGVERVLEVLAAASASTALDSSFALCFDGRLARALERIAVPVHELGPVQARRPDQVLRARRHLVAVLDVVRPDVALIHSAWAQAIFGPVLAANRVPMARWMHAPDPGPAWLEWWAARSGPSLVIANSRYTRDHLRRVGKGLPPAVIYPPMSAPAVADDARADVRRHLGVAPATLVIAVAARLEPWKGHQLLIDAFGRAAGADSELWVIGGAQRPSEQEYFSALCRQASGQGLEARVRFLGQRDDVARLLRAADIYCQPNTGPEPFGLAFVEALGAGLPVVATHMGAAPEIVDPDCGLLVQPHVDAVAAALASLMTDPGHRQRLAANARRRAEIFCDRDASVGALLGALRQVARPASTR